MYDQFYNFFELTWDNEVACFGPKSNELKSHFFVFFVGSQLAVAVFIVDNNESIKKIIKMEKVQFLFNVLSFFIALFAIFYQTEFYFGVKNDFK